MNEDIHTNTSITCTKCQSKNIAKAGKKNDHQRYQCKTCRVTLSLLDLIYQSQLRQSKNKPPSPVYDVNPKTSSSLG